MRLLVKVVLMLTLSVISLCSCNTEGEGEDCVWMRYESWPPENMEHILHESVIYYLRVPEDSKGGQGFNLYSESYHDFRYLPSSFWQDCENSLENQYVEIYGSVLSGGFQCRATESVWKIVICIYNKFDQEGRYEATYRANTFRAIYVSELDRRSPVNSGHCRFQ